MHNFDKAKILQDRHIKIIIEWGGVKDIFTSMSAMSLPGVVSFLDIISLDDEKEINDGLTHLIQNEDEQQ